jgi:4-hydroxyphenylacetate 3-monooxygenase oxygenase component
MPSAVNGHGNKKSLGPGALNGQLYLESLRDGREVWVNGERIKDVTAHPFFAGMCREMARIYDMQHAPETIDKMTFVNENGTRVSYSYLEPKSYEDLVLRRRNSEIWAQESFGMMGRYPDFCAAISVGFKNAGDELAKLNPAFAKNAAWHHQFASENDLCLGHGLHDPTMDKTLRPEQDPDRCLRIVEETDGGYVVRGARLVTLAPLVHEMQIAPTYQLNEREKDHAIWFAIPANVKGLKIVCREPFSNRSQFDHPASSRFDEEDAMVIFDDVLVPYERVFLAREPLAAGRLFGPRVMAHAGSSAVVQAIARLELLIGIAHLMAKTAGIDSRPQVQVEIGELVTYARVLQSILRAAEADCVKLPNGIVIPGPMVHQRTFLAMVSERIVNILEHIGSSSLIFAPGEKDFDTPELRPFLDLYARGKGVAAIDRVKLAKLAWDVTGDQFGGRQQLYERLHSGDPQAVISLAYQQYDKSKAVKMVERLIEAQF